ncbi:hypothetical protein N7495_007333 [Penicillium taxi]|uniref:uncharacterized protein n=1 Tax=Penicillium taxi TaxID=168475 RepID=UPI0025455CA1|nr:uncharacterized protein N7495_007333 [Penicillium taxi]KAJ5895642.1 hypothetical protein N7495_007333 [Penicillium taxi]
MILLKSAALQRLAGPRLGVHCTLRPGKAAILCPWTATRALRSISTWRALQSELDEQTGEKVHIKDLEAQDPLIIIETEAARLRDEKEAQQNAEIEAYTDIREYLRNWQNTNPPTLDPFQEPGALIDGAQAGGMLNGREASDSVWNTTLMNNQEDLDYSEESQGEHLQSGDLVARLSSDGTFSFAIYVQSVYRQKQFYISKGNWRVCSPGEIDYVIKEFAPLELLEPIKPYFPTSLTHVIPEIQTIPEGGLPRPLGAPLLSMMTNLHGHILDFYQKHSESLDNIYDMVADTSEFLRLTLEEMAMTVLSIDESELNSVNLFAVHQAIRRYPFLIEKSSTSLICYTYLIQPKRVAKVINQVTDWAREHQEICVKAASRKKGDNLQTNHPMQKFIAKSQRLIHRSRKLRSPTIMSSLGPSSQRFSPGQDGKPMVFREVLTETFTPDDQIIIEYLQLYAIPSVIMPSGTLKSTASHIMRATGMYNSLGLSSASSRLFLQELGVVSPWENLALLDQTLLLPGHGMSLMEDMRWEENEEACSKLESMNDSMQDLRKDWGDLPVYCVDDITAQEIDDGVSLERIPGSDDIFWVHIHVANPTAFLAHDHPIMEYAGSRLLTTYTPERTYPIFPKSFTQNHFSLSPGRPTLTFSAKMNLQGEVLDTEVANGTIRNVISVTHRTVQEFLSQNADKPTSFLVVGGPPSAASDSTVFREELTPEDKDTFTILRQLMLGFRSQRQKNGAIDLPAQPNTSLSVQLGLIPAKPYDLQVTEGRHYIGDPRIELRMQDFDPHEVRDESKNYLISLLMNLAGHVAGQFCATRNIPVVYNGTWYDPEYSRLTSQNIHQFGGQGFYHLGMPKAFASTEPLQHHILGLDSYIKSTSPLRRWNDVIAHYQIEAALRFEAEYGRRFDVNTDSPGSTYEDIPETTEFEEESQPATSLLPFSRADLDDHITYSQPIQTRLNQISKYSTQHWACMLLLRAFYFGECPLPETFQCFLRSQRHGSDILDTTYSGVITSLGVNCVVVIPESCPDKDRMDVFGVVEATITAVDMATLEVKMKATKLVKLFERTGEWA